MRLRLAILSVALLGGIGGASCSRGASHELQGQIVAIDPARQEITIKHGDIRGFMPGMTMPFKVKDPGLLSGKNVGDLVRGTLVVDETLGYLTSVDVTGHAPLTEPPPARAGADLLQPGDSAPDVSLIDQDGAAHRFSEWQGRVLAVTFIYTRCPLPDFCPLMDKHFKAVQDASLEDPQLAARLHLVSVTIDPSFDTPPVLRDHAKRAGARPELWSFVTGEKADLAGFGARFGVSVLAGGAEDADLVHNLRTAVVDKDGRVRTVFSGNDWSAGDLLKELRRAAGLS